MVGELFINNKDAYTTWHITFGAGSFTTLLTPVPKKTYIENKSALLPGKQVLNDSEHAPEDDERDMQLIFWIQAPGMDIFLQRFESFTQELKKGKLDIRTKYQPGVTYHCNYLSCQQFTQFNGRLGKFILKVNEYNPSDRS